MYKKIFMFGLLFVLVSGLSGLTAAQKIKSDYPPTHLRSLRKTQVRDGLISQKPAKAGENGSGIQLTFSGVEKWYCAWSPDGRYIGFEEDGDIWVVDTTSSTMLLNLTEEIDGYCYDVRFLPVGHSIMFTNYNFETGQSSVDFISFGNHVVAANDAAYGIYCHKFQYLAYRIDSTSELALYDRLLDKPTIILAEGDYGYGSTCFSPDDTYVVTAMVTQDGSLKLFKIPVEGGEPEQLTFHSGEHDYPEISPDGKWMLYTVTDEFGMYVLYTYNMDTGESMQVFPEAMYPNLMGHFSPEGDRFCYLLGDENGINEVYIADFPDFVSGGATEINMVYIWGGSFEMGSNDGDDEEKPVHTVTLDDFEMSSTEITQYQYESVMGNNPSHFTGDVNLPVEGMNRFDAMIFCNRLSDFLGFKICYDENTWECDFSKNGYRLPTEAEWEYACRAGTTTKYYIGDTESDLERAGWYEVNSGGKTHTVGQKEPNAWGLYDMHGNVKEFCNDWYEKYINENVNNPTGAITGSYLIHRGGSWDLTAYGCRSAQRSIHASNGNGDNLGFRIVRREAAPVSLQLYSPNGGEILTPGTTYDITWTSGGISHVNLSYSIDGGSSWIFIAKDVPADPGFFIWEMPEIDSFNCLVKINRVKIIGLDYVGDVSDGMFSITKPPYLRITAPNSSVTWDTGSTQYITWDARDASTITIEYSTDDGNMWNIVATGVDAMTKSYKWTVPDDVSTECRVKITDESGSGVSSMSYAKFIIREPQVVKRLRIIVPNYSVDWEAGTTQKIEWESSNIQYVDILYCTDVAENFTLIASKADASQQSYLWTIPDTPSTDCRVRIVENIDGNWGMSTKSYAKFTISPSPVTFPDPNLEAAIREALDKPEGPITKDDLAGLTNIGASTWNISDLAGIEYCVNLQWLNLFVNQISDLGPLSNLTNLQTLLLNGNQISDLGPLSNLTNLNWLNLHDNYINDLSPLVNLTNLQVLSLDNNMIQDISPLAGLEMIGDFEWEQDGVNIDLGLSNNRISDISPLVSNTGIGEGDGIALGGNPLSNEAYNNQIPALQARGANVLFDPPGEVTINDPNLEAAIREALDKPEGTLTGDDLAGLTEELDASEWDISDLTGIEHCVNLSSLSLDGNQISNLSPLSGLTNLACLGLSDNQISDISPLSNLTNLQLLYLHFNQISDIRPLSSLINQQKLILAVNQISDLSPLSSLISLQELVMSSNQISDISPLSNLTNLQCLHLQTNQINDLSPLVNLTDLRVLYLDENQIQDISHLAGMKMIGEVEELEGWVNDEREGVMIHLGLSYNKISDISTLVSNTGIGEGDGIDLRGYPLSIKAHETHIPALQARGVNVLFDSPAAVTISDPNLEAAIREALSKPTGALTYEDLAGLTYLVASERDISDLTGIERCVNLQDLNLGKNQISDLSPLSDLNNLENLVLWGNQISNLSPLSNLTNLWGLNLHVNQISDLSPLSSLTNLQSLTVDMNQISDISPLSNLTNLQLLNLSRNQIGDLSPLSSLTNLQSLTVDMNQISDISPLINLTDLRFFYLDNNRIQDISPLAGLKMIGEGEGWEGLIDEREGVNIHLGLSGNRISDISPLVSNTGIGEGDGIDLRGNPLSNEAYNNQIPALQARGANVLFDPPGEVTINDPNLEAAIREELNKPTGAITDEDLAVLTGLGASERGISDLTGIEHCVNLQDLHIFYNQISDLSPLSNLTNLQRLQLDGNQISDLSPLSSLTNLKWLQLGRNQISDLSPLNNLTNLQWLHLDGNQISNISPLINLTNLRVLYLHVNQIQDISPLAGLKMIGEVEVWEVWGHEQNGVRIYLDLSNNQISDISPLVSNTGIGEGDGIDLRRNPLSKEAYNNQIPALQSRGANVLFDLPGAVTITLSAPNGGEEWEAGSTQIIKWTSQGVSKFDLVYSTDGGNTWTVIGDNLTVRILLGADQANRQYAWEIPDTPSSTCRVRIYDTDNHDVFGESADNFTIKPEAGERYIEVLTPNGGEEWYAGETYDIEWDSDGLANVQIWYTPDSGIHWFDIIQSAPASEDYYSWTIPGDLDIPTCHISVGDPDDNTFYDVSDEAFSIIPSEEEAYLELTYPDGGETIPAGSTLGISWDSNGVNKVHIECSTDNGVNWINIVYDFTAFDGYYEWEVPDDIESTQCIIWIGDADNEDIEDESDDVFTIEPAGEEVYIDVLYPDGGEMLVAGEENIISWESVGVSYVDIYFTIDGGDQHFEMIAENVDASSGSYPWTIATDADIESSDCYVILKDPSDDTIEDWSDNAFTITQGSLEPFIAVTSPGDGQEWEEATEQDVMWQSLMVSQVRIEYSTDGGQNWKPVVNQTDATTGVYRWVIPNEVSQNCKIRITDVNNSAITADTMGLFAITQAPFLMLTSPNGGEEWKIGEVHDITWEYYGVNDLRIEFTSDDGASWTTEVEHSDITPGKFIWTIPDIESSLCRIRITATDNEAIGGVSNDTFTIAREPFIQVTAPVEGDQWEEESTQTIEWTNSSVSRVNIEYSTDDGGSWGNIISDIDASAGSYEWTVPEGEYEKCFIRVSNAEDSAVNGVSGSFRIITSDYINITAPSAGDKWTVNIDKEIKWEVKGVANVSIEVSYNDGNTWADILTASIDAYSGAYSWMVPDTPAGLCRIRIADITRPNIVFFITEPFEIIRPEVKIAHTPQTEAHENEEITFTASVTATADIKTVIFSYNRMGKSETKITNPMELSGENTYSYTLPAGVFIAPGIEYRIVATDVNDVEGSSPVDVGLHSINAIVSEVNSTNEVKGGSEQTAYRMISIPLYLNATSIVEQIKNSIPLGDTGTHWRLFRYPAGSTVPYEYPDIEPFMPGRAFWLISVNNFVLRTPEGKTVPTDEPFQIELKSGWNDIANPWMFNIARADIENPGNANLSALYTYEGQWSDPTKAPDTLEPWKGYAVRNLESGNRIIRLRTKSMTEKPAVAQDTEIWKLSIKASAGEALDTANHLGVRHDASVEWDKYDHVEPPPVGKYVSVSFPHYDWSEYPYNYTVDFRPPGNTISWDFNIKTNISHETVNIKFEGIDNLPDGLSLLLIDRDIDERIDISGDSFSLVSANDITERHFTLLVTDSTEPEPEQTDVKPGEFVTANCFPNPFNPQTTLRYELSKAGKVKISVFNSLGQMVRTYEPGYMAQGIHELVFDAVELTSGLYIYRIDAGYASVTGKMLYMK